MRKQGIHMKKFLVGLGALVFGGAFWACSAFDKTSGTDEQSEGIVALAGKKISGKAQKGPLVKGSEVVLRETSAEGNLEPTGREFHTTIINDSGEFRIDSLDLESQYVLISAEGYYTHERSDGVRDMEEMLGIVFDYRSECPMRLDAVSNLNNRNTANINLLTHFEYKRVLKLVGEGKSFAEAKRQASREVLGAFGVDINVSSAEDLDIFNTSEGDRTLFNISLLLDNRSNWDIRDGERIRANYDGYIPYVNIDSADIDCSKLQKYIDGFANDFADDGVLSDTIMQILASDAYSTAMDYSHFEFIDEDDMREKEGGSSYEILSTMKKRYEFSKYLFLNYMGLERCTEDLWGEYREFHKPIQVWDRGEDQWVTKDSGYYLCNGFNWEMTTMEHIDSLSLRIDHENGFMTDLRDGQKYKTVSFVHDGQYYEWMAEDLRYNINPVVHSRRAKGNRPVGIYNWTEAMQFSESYMTRPVSNDMMDSLHQGICPDGWHLANYEEWMALIDYVGGVNNLLDETWRTSREFAFGKGLIGVFYNRFDFNLVPMDKKYLEVYYHTYEKGSYGKIYEMDESTRTWLATIEDEEERRAIEEIMLAPEKGVFAFEMSIDMTRKREEAQREGRVRCVKN